MIIDIQWVKEMANLLKNSGRVINTTFIGSVSEDKIIGTEIISLKISPNAIIGDMNITSKSDIDNFDKSDKLNILYNKNSTISGIPHVFLYYYVPIKYQHDEKYNFTQEVKSSCIKIWNFKDGICQDWAINAVTEVLDICNYNGRSNPKLTFVCIPASTISSNNQRFKYFSLEICKRLCLENGFDHINIVKEKTPKHISGVESEYELEIDPLFFAGKEIILFDDVVTKGHSMQKFMQRLQKVNAKTVLCLSLGKTYFPPVTTINPINPYTGHHLLVDSQEQTTADANLITSNTNTFRQDLQENSCFGGSVSQIKSGSISTKGQENELNHGISGTTNPASVAPISRNSYPSDIRSTSNSSTSGSFATVVNKNTDNQPYKNKEQYKQMLERKLQRLKQDNINLKAELAEILSKQGKEENSRLGDSASQIKSDSILTSGQKNEPNPALSDTNKKDKINTKDNSNLANLKVPVTDHTSDSSDYLSSSYSRSYGGGSGGNSGCGVIIFILIILFVFVF